MMDTLLLTAQLIAVPGLFWTADRTWRRLRGVQFTAVVNICADRGQWRGEGDDERECGERDLHMC